jgi:hypothetical protein
VPAAVRRATVLRCRKLRRLPWRRIAVDLGIAVALGAVVSVGVVVCVMVLLVVVVVLAW